ncbi:MAG: hypothetical protein GY787_16490 [Alteromonadales bacterium]|nr:hypothetical protein [Alteromonadales bacterium]
MYGVDKYQVSFSYHRIKKYKPILALQSDENLLSIRTKGPVLLILPIDEYEELNVSIFHDYMVWQLVKIEVEDIESDK